MKTRRWLLGVGSVFLLAAQGGTAERYVALPLAVVSEMSLCAVADAAPAAEPKVEEPIDFQRARQLMERRRPRRKARTGRRGLFAAGARSP